LSGTYGDFTFNEATGAWTYDLDNTRAATQALRDGETVYDRLTVTSIDSTQTSIDVKVNGSNDTAVISGSATGTVTEAGGLNNATAGTPSASGTVNVTDVDSGQAGFKIPNSLSGTYGDFTFNEATGAWTYDLDNTRAATQALRDGETVHDRLTVTSTDDTQKVIDVTVNGTNDAPETSDVVINEIKEDSGGRLITQAELLAHATDIDSAALTATNLQISSGNGTLLDNGNGTWTYTPAPNDDNAVSFSYNVTDGLADTNGSASLGIKAVADAPSLKIESSSPTDTGFIKYTWANSSNVNSLNITTNGNGENPDTLQSKIDNTKVTPTIENELVTNIESIGTNAVPQGTASLQTGYIYLEAGTAYKFSGYGDDSIKITVGTTFSVGTTWGAGNSGKFSSTFTPITTGYYEIKIYHSNSNGPGNYDVNLNDINLSTTNYELYQKVTDITASGIQLSPLDPGGFYAGFNLNHGNEDTPIALSKITANLVDTDGSETLHITVSSIPEGAVLSDGIHTFTSSIGHTSTDVNGWNLSTLTITPPQNFNGNFSLQVTATSTESSNGDSASNSGTINVEVYSVNDTAIIGGTATGTVTEAGGLNNATLGTPSASGTLTVTDVDSGQAGFQIPNNLSGTYGTFTFNAATGAWTYALDNTRAATQTLKAGDAVLDTLTVTSTDGTQKVIEVTVNGSNDTAVIGGTATGTVTEAGGLNNATVGTPSASGTLTVTDVDSGQAGFQIPNSLAGTYGTFTFNAATGAWTYALDNTRAATQALKAGDAVLDTLTVTSTDGTQKVIDVTVNGSNDAPVAVNDSIHLPQSSLLSGLSAEFYNYNEKTSGGNLTNLTQIEEYINANNPNATFTSNVLNYAYGSGNLGGTGKLENWIKGNSSNLVFYNQQSTGDAIVKLQGNVTLAAGTYNFRITSDDGYTIRIDGVVVAQVNANQSPKTTTHESFKIATGGSHDIEIIYWDQGGEFVFQPALRMGSGEYSYLGQSAFPTNYQSGVEGGNYVYQLSVAELLANDTDVDTSRSNLQITGVSNPSDGGTVTLNNGIITFTAPPDFDGKATFTYSLSDGSGEQSSAVVTLVNEKPVLDLDNKSDLPFTFNATESNGDQISGNLNVAEAGKDIIGKNHNETLHGDSHDNEIFGKDGDDTIYGGDGNDLIFGGNGNDIINGGDGNDEMTGGGGQDIFAFESTKSGSIPTIDTITDFKLDLKNDDSSDNDILDLTQLFKDHTLNEDNLDSLLQISTINNPETNQTDTVIKVDSDGKGPSETIVLSGVDVVDAYGTSDSSEIVSLMLAANLIVV
jgi:VCBS repeat-containing protein